jgi:hypothetical protein
MPALAVARLRRADGGLVYDFTAVYALARAGGRLRIVAIAHDETPKAAGCPRLAALTQRQRAKRARPGPFAHTARSSEISCEAGSPFVAGAYSSTHLVLGQTCPPKTNVRPAGMSER